MHPNNINLVRNVAGVSASDDDLHAFVGSTGTLPHTKAVTLSLGSGQLMVNGSGSTVTYGSMLMVQGMKRQNGISKRDQGFFDPILNKG